MSVLFLFVDGVGLGSEEEENPFLLSDYKGFNALAGDQPFSARAREIAEKNYTFRQVDATLGVEGLPQSGTGQTTLFSGHNAAKEIGKHFGPFPHSGIRHLLGKESLFSKVQQLDKNCQFINAYPDIYFQKARQRNRWSCTTLMAQKAGLSLNTKQDVLDGKALTAELTQKAWREKLRLDVPEISPEEASRVLISQLDRYDLLLHEYYLTDKAGHSQSLKKAEQYLTIYDRFLFHLIENKPAETTLVLCSDHGNIEDLSVKTHTFNKVPLFVLGPGAPYFAEAKSITAVTPGIVSYLKETN